MENKVRLLRHLQHQGIDTTQPIPIDSFKEARLVALPVTQLVEGAYRKIAEKVKQDALHFGMVKIEKSDANIRICESNICGYYHLTAEVDGTISPVCLDCACVGRDLIRKTRSKKGKCTRGHWSNLDAE